VFDTGQGRETGAADAHAIVMVALRDKGLREPRIDPELTVLRMLCGRRDELSRARAQALNRLPRLFPGLLAGRAPVKKPASQHRALLATVRPRDLAGKTRRRMAAEEPEDIERPDVQLKAMKAGLKAAVLATGSHLTDIRGTGPAGAARILAGAGDIARFPSRGHFASRNGTAPVDASSGQHTGHRLSRAGNRRINPVLYIAGITQLRNDTTGRAYCRRKLQQSKTSMEAMRALRRRLPDAAYRQLVTDAARRRATQQASPAKPSAAVPPSSPAALATPAAPAAATTRRHAGADNAERPTGRTTLTPASAGARSTAPGPRT
jgi:transposase